MLKDMTTLIQALKNSPAVAVVAICLIIIAGLVSLGYKDMTQRGVELKNDFQRLELKVDEVDNKVDWLSYQVNASANNDSTVIREQARFFQQLRELETQMKEMERNR